MLKKVFQLKRAIVKLADEYVETEDSETQDEKSHSKVQNLAETHVKTEKSKKSLNQD